MNATQNPTTVLAQTAPVDETERIRADYQRVKKLGNWTAARRFAVRARRGHVVLDLRSPHIPPGDIDITLDLDHTMVRLLLPVDAVIDDEELRWTGRGRIKDYQARADTPKTRMVRISGEIRHGEIRVNREGVAMLSAMFSKAYARDVLRAHREGGYPTVDDPARENPTRS
ncbi:MAG TPA: hypothetical protein VHX38_27455 [Pseudonocardiaceae bacterium]|jgi:hypothetical protein|nr:hypothetical protein [Pseudonocardiaceae bacterium]